MDFNSTAAAPARGGEFPRARDQASPLYLPAWLALRLSVPGILSASAGQQPYEVQA